MRSFIAASIAALALSACSASEEPAADSGEAAEEQAAKDEAAETPSAACKAVSAEMGKAILDGAQEGTGDLKFIDAAAVKSEDHGNAFYIAIAFSGAGFEEEVGIWASNSLKPGGGLIMSVDGMAKEFTVWPDASTTDAAMSVADQGAEEAAACLEG